MSHTTRSLLPNETPRLSSIYRPVPWKHNVTVAKYRNDIHHFSHLICNEQKPWTLSVTRLTSCLLCCALISWSVCVTSNKAEWPLYYTHWILVLTLAMFLFGFIASLQGLRRRLKIIEFEVLPRYVSVFWVLYSATSTMSVLITLMHYFMYKYEQKSFSELPIDVIINLCNTILIMIEVCISSVPVFAVHIYLPLGLGLLYIIFALGYYSLTGVIIYEVLDVNIQMQTFAWIVILFVLSVVIYMLLWLGYTIKTKTVRSQDV
ncbi:ORF106 protein [Operophtera brumata nucleopolyhedrovirus]|uniref:ORF106 protein n=1 Tax=Operophtera brumata nucleopolyhedrovirus TaxID=1046267 RepID=A0A2H4UZY9_9ABAC|nr:ORF106 protein [Operophtera brumata nucleopolyhedrovirus]AUA60337.1 ORF106 protein [Operophtera brumata nucleopolyhedrovirus]